MSLILNPTTGRAATLETVEIPWEKLKYLIEIEPLMQSMGFGIHCNHCSRVFGVPKDGVHMWVGEGDKEFHLDCNHCNRVCKVDRAIKI